MSHNYRGHFGTQVVSLYKSLIRGKELLSVAANCFNQNCHVGPPMATCTLLDVDITYLHQSDC
jgi:hypothetical protein